MRTHILGYSLADIFTFAIIAIPTVYCAFQIVLLDADLQRQNAELMEQNRALQVQVQSCECPSLVLAPTR